MEQPDPMYLVVTEHGDDVWIQGFAHTDFHADQDEHLRHKTPSERFNWVTNMSIVPMTEAELLAFPNGARALAEWRAGDHSRRARVLQATANEDEIKDEMFLMEGEFRRMTG